MAKKLGGDILILPISYWMLSMSNADSKLHDLGLQLPQEFTCLTFYVLCLTLEYTSTQGAPYRLLANNKEICVFYSVFDHGARFCLYTHRLL